MRLSLPALVAAMLVFALPAEGQNRLTPREISDVIREYGLSGTREDRRVEIVRALDGAPEGKTIGGLKKMAKDAPALAVRLAVALRHPRAWSIVSPALAGEGEREVLAPLFPDPPGDCRDEMIKRWERLDAGSPSFELLTDLYVANPEVSALDVDVFARALKDAGRGVGAARIMTALLGLEPPAGQRLEPADVLAQWELVEKTWRQHARVFRPAGDQIIPSSERKEGAIAVRGPNRLLGPQGLLEFTRLGAWQARSHDLVIRFLPLTDSGFRIGYCCTQGNWVLVASAPGSLSMRASGGGEATAPFVAREWNEVRFSVECQAGDAFGKQRVVRIYVNGREVAEGTPLGLSGDLTSIFMHAESGRFVVGGAELVVR